MNNSRKILMTGVTGFVGKTVAPFLVERGHIIVCAGRNSPEIQGVEFSAVSKIDRYTQWKTSLTGVDAVVHLAGRAHQMNDSAEEQHLYYETNVEGTVNLAQQAAAAGVEKFVFISSIKAMLSSSHDVALTESFPCNPLEPYGMSKLKAEIELRKISETTGMKVVILRPPLVYGPGVKGNLASLVRLVHRLPALPLGGISNRRSLLGVKNLASAIEAVLISSAADGRTYLVSDGEEISTSELVARLAEVYNPSCRIWALPSIFWKIAGRLPGLTLKVARLTGSLPIDSSLITREIGWKAPFSMREQL
jgi:nucleoside-diphosphate-sugar epimerase